MLLNTWFLNLVLVTVAVDFVLCIFFIETVMSLLCPFSTFVEKLAHVWLPLFCLWFLSHVLKSRNLTQKYTQKVWVYTSLYKCRM